MALAQIIPNVEPTQKRDSEWESDTDTDTNTETDEDEDEDEAPKRKRKRIEGMSGSAVTSALATIDLHQTSYQVCIFIQSLTNLICFPINSYIRRI